ARGALSTSLDALSALLHERARAALERGNTNAARAATRALDDVERAKERASGNVNPQLITSELLRRLEDQLRCPLTRAVSRTSRRTAPRAWSTWAPSPTPAE